MANPQRILPHSRWTLYQLSLIIYSCLCGRQIQIIKSTNNLSHLESISVKITVYILHMFLLLLSGKPNCSITPVEALETIQQGGEDSNIFSPGKKIQITTVQTNLWLWLPEKAFLLSNCLVPIIGPIFLHYCEYMSAKL